MAKKLVFFYDFGCQILKRKLKLPNSTLGPTGSQNYRKMAILIILIIFVAKSD
jgi:hypothetical protein